MCANLFKIVFRNIKRQKIYSFINIFGLAVGIAGCILILFWVEEEMSYDRFHENTENLYRVLMEDQSSGKTLKYALNPAPLGPALKKDYPEIKKFTRVIRTQNLLKRKDVSYTEKGLAVDPSFLEMFTFPSLKGEKNAALRDPFSVVVSEKLAHKYFGRDNPVGEIIKFDNEFDFMVKAVIEDVPDNSHLQFDYLIPAGTLQKNWNRLQKAWNAIWLYTYIQLKDNSSVDVVNPKISGILDRYYDGKEETAVHLQPLKKIHLFSSDIRYGISGQGSLQYIYIFSGIALFVLVIACINFINLSTARHIKRAKEVGVRKVIGAFRWNLIKQFYGESLILTLMALLVALWLVSMALPVFNNVTGKNLDISYLFDESFLLLILGVAVFTSIVAGAYPALYLSKFQPAKVLKESVSAGKKSSFFRKVLVVTQFTLSVYLITGTGIIYGQINYLRNKNLGYSQEHIICVPLQSDSEYSYLKHELLKNTNILNVTAMDQNFVDLGKSKTGFLWKGKEIEKKQKFYVARVDSHFLETFDIELIKGRDFSPQFLSDEKNSILINEEASGIMGLKNPVHSSVKRRGHEHQIIGVVKNFHFKSLHRKMEPLILSLDKDGFKYSYVKIKGKDVSSTLQYIRETWDNITPDWPFQYHFLDEQYDKLYKSEQKMKSIIHYFAVFALLIAGIGLFGLSNFSIEQRIKEIGIRKVLGASSRNIFFLLTKQFMVCVGIANGIAWLLAWFSANRWLQNFAYRVDIHFSIFFISSLISVAAALLFVSYRAVKSAAINPADSLRYE